MNNETIQLIPTDALIKELIRRFDHAVFTGRIDRPDASIRSRRWKGDADICAGLAAGCFTFINKQTREDEHALPAEHNEL